MPHPWRSFLAAACFAWLPAVALGQPAPIGPEFQINAFSKGLQMVGGIASDVDGNFVVAWESGFVSPPPTQDGSGAGIFVRRFDATGKPLSGDLQVNVFTQGDQRDPDVGSTPEGDFVVVWSSWEQDGPGRETAYARRFTREGTPQGGEIRLGESAFNEHAPAVAVCPDGSFVAAWQSFQFQAGAAILARWFDPQGAPRGGEILVEELPDFGNVDAACDGEGRVAIVWESCCEHFGESAEIHARLFDPAGIPLGEVFQVDGNAGRTFNPAVSFAPDGSFAVAWDTYRQAWVRRFSRDGAPTSAPVRVSTPTGDDDDFQGYAEPLLDAAGNLLVTWSRAPEVGIFSVHGKWYDSLGNEKGGPFRLDTATEFNQTGARVAAQPHGGFVAAWIIGNYLGAGPDGDQWGVFAQRFAIPAAGADPCVWSPEGLSCDLFHDGGEGEALTVFGQAGDVPLLGNLDRDSRDDLCVYRGGRFLCDTAHDGAPAEKVIAFGLAGDVPLLGDLNGDGRDDPCVRRGRRFACDTAHNGGTAEVQVVFGQFRDTALLGDVDGDGDDDPCLFRGDRFLCDTVHDGRTAEVIAVFGQTGDVPLLGDLDGDGDDDFCVFRGGRFLCDTAHDGGASEVEIDFGGAGTLPVLGNVNGI